MAIHYRTYFKGEPRSGVFRSLKHARDSRIDDMDVVGAFPSRKAAIADKGPHLWVSDDDPAPEFLAPLKVRLFVASHDNIRTINGKRGYIDKASRQRFEEQYRGRLFGFAPGGESIDARQFMSVSSRYITYRCPIYINSYKVNFRNLEALFPETDA